MNKNEKKTSKRLPKWEREANAFDAKVSERNAKNHESLAFGVADLVSKNPRIEWEIVINYLKRKNKVMIDRPAEENKSVKKKATSKKTK